MKQLHTLMYSVLYNIGWKANLCYLILLIVTDEYLKRTAKKGEDRPETVSDF